jgi:uncharacterized protein (DUF2141 family)
MQRLSFHRQNVWLTGWLLGLGLVPALGTSAEANKMPVKVVFSEVTPLEGKIFCNLFTQPEGFPGDPDKAIDTITVPADKAEKTCDFGSVDPGTYAIGAMHDANGNGEMDTNLIGIPQEGWVVSRNASPGMFGPPSFEDARFEVKDQPITFNLQFRY